MTMEGTSNREEADAEMATEIRESARRESARKAHSCLIDYYVHHFDGESVEIADVVNHLFAASKGKEG
jgi:hypothetical protein